MGTHIDGLRQKLTNIPRQPSSRSSISAHSLGATPPRGMRGSILILLVFLFLGLSDAIIASSASPSPIRTTAAATASSAICFFVGAFSPHQPREEKGGGKATQGAASEEGVETQQVVTLMTPWMDEGHGRWWWWQQGAIFGCPEDGPSPANPKGVLRILHLQCHHRFARQCQQQPARETQLCTFGKALEQVFPYAILNPFHSMITNTPSPLLPFPLFPEWSFRTQSLCRPMPHLFCSQPVLMVVDISCMLLR